MILITEGFSMNHKTIKRSKIVKIYRFSIMLITVMLALALSNPALADEFTDTIDIYKKSGSVQPFFKDTYGGSITSLLMDS